MQPDPANRTSQHVSAPSDWVIRFGMLVPAGGTVLDVACGDGRHAHWFIRHGCLVAAVDRERSPGLSPRVEFTLADIEAGAWPYAGRAFCAVVVTNYLHRPLMATLVDSVAQDGWLIYETFAAGNEKFGSPRRPEHLLQPGELLDAVRGRLKVVAYEECRIGTPRPAIVQRIAARLATD